MRPHANTQAVALPSLELARMDGQTANLVSLKGKPVVLNAWASWCVPCRREMPLLLEAAKKNPQLQFVFVNVSDGPEAVKAFQKDIGLEIPNVMLDPDAKISNLLDIQGLPVTLTFKPDGTLLGRHIGEIKAPTLQEMLQAL